MSKNEKSNEKSNNNNNNKQAQKAAGGGGNAKKKQVSDDELLKQFAEQQKSQPQQNTKKKNEPKILTQEEKKAKHATLLSLQKENKEKTPIEELLEQKQKQSNSNKKPKAEGEGEKQGEENKKEEEKKEEEKKEEKATQQQQQQQVQVSLVELATSVLDAQVKLLKGSFKNCCWLSYCLNSMFLQAVNKGCRVVIGGSEDYANEAITASVVVDSVEAGHSFNQFWCGKDKYIIDITAEQFKNYFPGQKGWDISPKQAIPKKQFEASNYWKVLGEKKNFKSFIHTADPFLKMRNATKQDSAAGLKDYRSFVDYLLEYCGANWRQFTEKTSQALGESVKSKLGENTPKNSAEFEKLNDSNHEQLTKLSPEEYAFLYCKFFLQTQNRSQLPVPKYQFMSKFGQI